ncbi:MAG: DUF3108 domain-containing protein [Xanthomonadales bacterium]|nr:DUF3108 domain-containing protein [Xanthomonadales bacterium]
MVRCTDSRCLLRRLLPVLVFFVAAPTLAASVPPAHVATYEVSRNGKLTGEMEQRFEAADGRWQMSSSTRGTRGVARLLGIDANDRAQGVVRDGAARPGQFEHQASVPGRDQEWSAEFDASGQQVTVQFADGEQTLALPGQAWDPLGVQMALRDAARGGRGEWTVHVVDEDEVEVHRYRTGTAERVDTPLGCFEAVPVERVREQSTRYTRVWLAPALDWLPVRFEHGKTDGSHTDARLQSLQRTGQAFSGQAHCEGGLSAASNH